MREVFNLGIGLILVVRPEDVTQSLVMLADSAPVIIGKIA
jgi:phosphoribosylaminoimidazole (AIR) synthetase